jgi:hypothetical protein
MKTANGDIGANPSVLGTQADARRCRHNGGDRRQAPCGAPRAIGVRRHAKTAERERGALGRGPAPTTAFGRGRRGGNGARGPSSAKPTIGDIVNCTQRAGPAPGRLGGRMPQPAPNRVVYIQTTIALTAKTAINTPSVVSASICSSAIGSFVKEPKAGLLLRPPSDEPTGTSWRAAIPSQKPTGGDIVECTQRTRLAVGATRRPFAA